MELAVVIVTHNQHDLLRQCLRTVVTEMQDLAGEVIVIDNESTDPTPRVMAEEFPDVRCIRNETNVHYTRAVNQGMRATNSPYVFLLNDDTRIEPGCFRKLVAFMENHPRCGVVGPALVSPDGDVQVSAQKFPTPFREMMDVTGIAWSLRNQSWASGIQVQYPQPLGAQLVDWVCGGALFLRRSVMETLGYHDENYLFYRDDPDIGMRMKAAGWEVGYYPEARVVHDHGMSTVKTENKARFDLIAVRSRRHYHRKFHGVPASVAVECTRGGCAIFRILKALVLWRPETFREQRHILALLFQALAVPQEEIEAIRGYRKAAYNGMEPTGPLDEDDERRITSISQRMKDGVAS